MSVWDVTPKNTRLAPAMAWKRVLRTGTSCTSSVLVCCSHAQGLGKNEAFYFILHGIAFGMFLFEICDQTCLSPLKICRVCLITWHKLILLDLSLLGEDLP